MPPTKILICIANSYQ